MAFFFVIEVKTSLGEPYWTLRRDPPFPALWDAPHFHLRAAAGDEVDRLNSAELER
jgi:hypothetical protein